MRCLKRRSDISAAEFRQFWNDTEYETLIRNLAEMSQAISQNRSLTLQIDINQEIANLHGTVEPFDGIIELCWSNAETIMAMRNSDDGLHGVDNLLAYEDQFIDRSESRYFFTE
jgi:hypothetical protein